VQVDVIILGAGAAGMFAAIEAGRRGRRVVVLEHARAPGEKIRISGGGRCNFTNRDLTPANAPLRFLSRNPRFALSALARYRPQDFIDRLDRAGIGWHEKALGQLFCDGSATQIVRLLVSDMAAAGVDLRLATEVREIGHDGLFRLRTDTAEIAAPALVVATGGKSVPKIGASDLGYRIARQFGVPVTETRPALVPLTFGDAARAEMAALAGVGLPARVSCGGAVFDEGLLFTHRGLSGPSILQISSYWREGAGLGVDLLPGADVAALLRARRQSGGRVALRTVLGDHLPERVAQMVERHAGRVGARVADLSDGAIGRIAAAAHGWQVVPTGSEGYRTAEVTLGGVDTDALDARTMAARGVPGLYFVGEVVDVTGWLGGYNFQWAWSSGWAAGQAI
jgi:predicted Rossmann fold flavoprotein